MSIPETRFAELDGAEVFCRWFGTEAPYFHDAKVESLVLRHGDETRLTIHAFRMTDQVDEAGYFVLEKHVLLTFVLRDVSAVRLESFDEGAILMGLTVLKDDSGVTLDLDPVIGVGGQISAGDCRVEFTPREAAG